MALSPTETGAEPPAELPSASSPFPATQQTRINREIEMSWRMPAETEPQARVRMAFPPRAS